ncbi:MAG: hypothetical protein J7K40_11445 [candidate division Zixibacteria bacterium]|nr:hypothetical protein [candidate division Zixibacteria bacterium]
MESPEKANMRFAQEHDTAEKHMHQRIDSIHLLAEMFNCSTDDVEIMLALLRKHGVYEMIEAVEDFNAGTPQKWSFGTVVIAAKNVTLKRLHGKIDDDLHRELSTVVVSTQPSIYGTAITDVERLDEKTLMAFSDMIKYGVNIDRINALVRSYNAMGEANVRT